MYADVILRPENECFWEKVSEVYQQNIEGNNSFRLRKCQKIKFARFARSHIHTFLLILVYCQYVVYTYSAIP